MTLKRLFKLGILGLITWSHLWILIGAEYFHMEGNNIRATDFKSMITATAGVTQKTHCLQVCSRNEECGGCNFKDDGVNSMCEILPPTAVSQNSASLSLQTGWKFYRKVFVTSSVYFSNEKYLCMPFDGKSDNLEPRTRIQPLACTGADYILNLWNTGYKDCKFTWEDNKEFNHYELETVTGNETTLWQIGLSKCHLSNCLGLVCHGTGCYLKSENHLSKSVDASTYFDRTGRTYWYATCK